MTYAGTTILKTGNSDDAEIADIRIVGNGTNDGIGHDGNAATWFRAKMTNVYMRDFVTCIAPQYCVFADFRNCEFIGDSPVVFGDTYNNCVTFTSCYFRSGAVGNYGCDFKSHSRFEGNNITFTTCAFDDHAGSGVRIKNARATFNTCYWEFITSDYVVGERANIVMNSGYMLGAAVAGTEVLFRLSDNSRLTIVAPVTVVDNYADYLIASDASHTITMFAAQSSSEITLNDTSTYTSIYDNIADQSTFTPVVRGSSTAGTGTYSLQLGRYKKIGNRVFYNLVIAWSAHDGTGNLRIAGFPYAADTTTDLTVPATITADSITFTGQLVARLFATGTPNPNVRVQVMATGAALADVALDTAGRIELEGSYTV